MTYFIAALLAFVSYVGTVRVLRITICSLGWHDFVKLCCPLKHAIKSDIIEYHPIVECKYCGRRQ
jgi:hypothetical protein